MDTMLLRTTERNSQGKEWDRVTPIKKKYWEEPDWQCVSWKRKYSWSLSEPSDYQDILSTYDCFSVDQFDDQEASEAEKQK